MTVRVFKPASGSSKITMNGLITSLIAPGGGTKLDFTILVWVTFLYEPVFRANGGGQARLYWYWPAINQDLEVDCGQDPSGSNPKPTVDSSFIVDDGNLHLVAITHDATAEEIRVYYDGIIRSTNLQVKSTTGWTPVNDAPYNSDINHASANESFAKLTVFDRCLSAAEVLSIHAGTVHHDITQPFSAWPGEIPKVLLSTDDLVNQGDGGDLGAAYVAGEYSEELEGSAPAATTTSVARNATVGNFPPVRTVYTTPGTAGGVFRVAGTAAATLFFPAAGDLGLASLRAWLKRPSSPVVSSGTVFEIVGGSSFIRADINGTTLTVTVSDGTLSVSNNVTIPVGVWFQLWIVHRDGLLSVFLNRLASVTIDTSTLTVDPTDAWTITIGGKGDGSNPIDIKIKAPAIYDFDIPDKVPPRLYEEGNGFDVRNPAKDPSEWDPTDEDDPDPTPPAYWIEPVVDDVVPPAEGNDVLVAFAGAGSEVEPGEIRSWWLGDHKIGIYSSAWFGDEAQDPAAWTLAFATAAHEDVFGECPRVVKVTARDDGALLLDLDAKAQPGIGYTLDGPDDLTGVSP